MNRDRAKEVTISMAEYRAMNHCIRLACILSARLRDDPDGPSPRRADVNLMKQVHELGALRDLEESAGFSKGRERA